MSAVLAVLLLLVPATLDLPPEGVYGPATASAPAVRLDPPVVVETVTTAPAYSSASSAGRCVGLEPLLAHYSPGWSVARMSAIAYRESRCDADVRNASSSATGLLQILASHCPWLARQMGEPCSRSRLGEAEYNIRAAAALWREQSYAAWSTS